MQIDNVALGRMSMFGFSLSLTPAATAAASAVEQTFTLPAGTLPAGIQLQASDVIDLSGPGSGNNVAVGGARADAAGHLIVQFINPTAGALTHAAGTFQVCVTRF